MTTYCPDCLFEVPVRKPGKDGRCEWCRPPRRHSQPREPKSMDRIDLALLAERKDTRR